MQLDLAGIMTPGPVHRVGNITKVVYKFQCHTSHIFTKIIRNNLWIFTNIVYKNISPFEKWNEPPIYFDLNVKNFLRILEFVKSFLIRF